MDRLTRITQLFGDISTDIFSLSQRLYGSSFRPSFVSLEPESSVPSAPQTQPASSATTVIHDHSVNYYTSPSPYCSWWYVPQAPTVIVSCPHSSRGECERCEKKKKSEETSDSNTNWYLGALLAGALALGFSYVFTTEYISHWKLAQVNTKVRRLEKKLRKPVEETSSAASSLYPPTSPTSISSQLRTIPKTWDLWYGDFRRTARLYTLCKLGFLVSGVLVGSGLMRNSSFLQQCGYWCLVGTGATTVSVVTFYHLLWKSEETKKMNQLVQDCNTIHLTLRSPSAPPLNP